jgi:hypothetical protein
MRPITDARDIGATGRVIGDRCDGDVDHAMIPRCTRRERASDTKPDVSSASRSAHLFDPQKRRTNSPQGGGAPCTASRSCGSAVLHSFCFADLLLLRSRTQTTRGGRRWSAEVVTRATVQHHVCAPLRLDDCCGPRYCIGAQRHRRQARLFCIHAAGHSCGLSGRSKSHNAASASRSRARSAGSHRPRGTPVGGLSGRAVVSCVDDHLARGR